MPWCERCDRFLNPNTVGADGTCPSCGRPVEPVSGRADEDDPAGDEPHVPWHFWVLVAGVVAYLGWRLVEGIVWVAANWF